MTTPQRDRESDEIVAAFIEFCTAGTVPALSDSSFEYVRHCLLEAARNARTSGKAVEEVAVWDHPLFALLAETVGSSEQVEDFLLAVTRARGDARPPTTKGAVS
jgi:hypothetical protein